MKTQPSLSVKVHGQGQPLVLLHAFPLTSAMWENQFEIFTKKFKVILPDLPGFGQSALQSEPSVPDMGLQVGHLLEHLNIQEPVILGGLSMGGYAAFEVLRQFPKKIKALMLFATRATPDSSEAKENRFKSIEAIEKFGLEPYVKKIIKSQLGKTTQEKHPELIHKAISIMLTNSKESAINGLKAMAVRRDSSDLLSKIKMPVLVVAGAEDGIAPAEEMRSMHQKIDGSEFHAIPECGHLINLEQPSLFNSLVENFLKKIG